jgi:hypothetical protein
MRVCSVPPLLILGAIVDILIEYTHRTYLDLDFRKKCNLVLQGVPPPSIFCVQRGGGKRLTQGVVQFGFGFWFGFESGVS